MSDYQLVSGDSPDDLSAKVRYFLKDGWQVWGSPFFNSNNGRYYQSIVK